MNALLLRIFTIIIALNVISCIPGTGSEVDEGETFVSDGGSKLNLKIIDNNGNVIRSVQRNQTVTVKATLTTSIYSNQANQVMTFSTDIGALSPSKGTALTDSSGVAIIHLITDATFGAGTLEASVSTDEGTFSINYNYNIAEDLDSTSTTEPAVAVDDSDDTTDTGSDTDVVDDTPVIEDLPSDAIVGSIQYIDTTPTTITLLGTGGTERSETAVVTFRLLDSEGFPIPDKIVNFSLNTEIGGLRMNPTSDVTDRNGEVSTLVYSGTVPTVVRVTAKAEVTSLEGDVYTIFTQSDKLVASTGIPDQNSLSIAISTFNPEAADFVGRKVTVSARLADLFNNIVPDGTAVYFSTEGGSIEPSCLTKDGGCEVFWTSGSPTPSDHRNTIIATAVGNESFIDSDSDGYFSDADGEPFTDLNRNNIYDEAFVDSNGNNLFDEPFVDSNSDGLYTPGESFTDHNRNGIYDGNGNNPIGETSFTDSAEGNGRYDGSGTIPAGEVYTDMNDNNEFDGAGFSDLGEPYLDSNENGQYDIGEVYFDSNNDGAYNALGDEKYNGALCRDNSNCSDDHATHVRASAVIITSGSQARIDIIDKNTGDLYASNHITSSNLVNYDNKSVNLNFILTDSAGQVMPAETKMALYFGNTDTTPIRQFTVKNSIYNDNSLYELILNDSTPGISSTSTYIIIVTTPSGEETYFSFQAEY